MTEKYRDPEQNDGLFDGFDPVTQLYDLETDGSAYQHKRSYRYSKGDEAARIERDDSLEHHRCVFQILRRHFARYTPEEGSAAARLYITRRFIVSRQRSVLDTTGRLSARALERHDGLVVLE